MLQQIIGLQAIILCLVGTVIALSRAFPYVPNGREGFWTICGSAGMIASGLGVVWFINGKLGLFGL